MSNTNTENTTVTYTCGHCATLVRASVAGETRGPTDDIPTAYFLSTCTRCGQPNLLERELLGLGYEEEPDWTETRIFPPEVHHLSLAIPKIVRSALQEARRVFQAGAVMSSALMCRQSIEMLAYDLGMRRGSLNTKLTKLHEDGQIDQRLYEWADMLRLVGNERD